MGRENGEDHATDYLVMLNTWDGAVSFLFRETASPQPIDIAILLAWFG